MEALHWIDDADHWRCPICGFEAGNPAYYHDCRCPICGFQDEKDKNEEDNKDEKYKKEAHNER